MLLEHNLKKTNNAAFLELVSNLTISADLLGNQKAHIILIACDILAPVAVI